MARNAYTRIKTAYHPHKAQYFRDILNGDFTVGVQEYRQTPRSPAEEAERIEALALKELWMADALQNLRAAIESQRNDLIDAAFDHFRSIWKDVHDGEKPLLRQKHLTNLMFASFSLSSENYKQN